MTRPTKKLLLTAMLALAVGGAPPAAAATFVAYGEGLTRCTIQAEKVADGGFLMLNSAPPLSHYENYEWWGETTCDRPLQQTAQASLREQVSPMCSGVVADCSSGGEGFWPAQAVQEPMEYRVTLRAPANQGWLGAPTDCTGVGTDNLKCVFRIDDSDVSLRRDHTSWLVDYVHEHGEPSWWSDWLASLVD
jgi:hypothetical protein